MAYTSTDRTDGNSISLVGPLYLQVANHLRCRILDGEWHANVALPNEGELAQHYHISLGTMRKALEHLVRSNMLVRYQGRGTFVRARNSMDLRCWPLSLTTDAGLDGGQMTITLLSSSSTTAGLADSGLLQVPLGSKVEYLICLTRSGQGGASHDTIILPSALVSAAAAASTNHSGDFPEALMPLMSTIIRCNDRIGTAYASEEQAAALGIKTGDMMLSVERQAIDRNGRTPFIIRRKVSGNVPLTYSFTS